MFGNLVDVPRYQKAYLRNYKFTGVHHHADPDLPAMITQLLDWANSQRHHWLPAPSAVVQAERGGIAGATPPGTVEHECQARVSRGSTANNSSHVDSGGLPKFNSCLINWYMDGHHYIGPHSDDERELVKGSPVFSATLGETRLFRFRGKGGTKGGAVGAVVRECMLRSGDLVVMGGACQSNYKHEIVKVTSKSKAALMGPRVNITFRMFL
jgi:hypothetical protein